MPSGTHLPFDQSIGYKVPLYLGGENCVHNMELIDTEGLWDLQYQTASRINELN